MKNSAGLNWFVIIILLLNSCGRSQHASSGMPSSSVIEKAERLSINITDSCTVITLYNPWQGASSVEIKYYLVRRGNKSVSLNDTSKIIYVPVRKIVCMSTTHLAMIAALGEEKSVTGFSGTGFIYNKNLFQMSESGLIEDVGYENSLNTELILKIKPDLVMMYGVGSESAGYTGKIEELGIKTMMNADYLEVDPLGKAEWIKLFGALYCREELADSIFRSIMGSYNEIRDRILQENLTRPKVLAGLPFRDTWYVSPGNSHISTLIRDAGGEYLWEKTISSVSMPLGLESVYLRSMEADYWINIGAVNSKNEIPAIDSRLSTIPAFKSGNLFNNNKRVTPGGGNDYWESGTLSPHLLLRDLASIFHPESFADHELIYYKPIE